MTITSTTVVTRRPEDVWAFLTDLRNTPKWDRSIARAVLASSGELATGAIVETTSPGGKRQRFRVLVFERPRLLRFRLLRSPLFRSADLTFRLDPTSAGTQITQEIRVQLRRWLFALRPILALTSRGALSTDLEFLRRALEEGLDLRSRAAPAR
jgi:uncharacterized protein YndB with AHSA1/START domain